MFVVIALLLTVAVIFSVFNTRCGVSDVALCNLFITGQIKTLRAELAMEQPQLVGKSAIMLGDSAVGVPTTMGLESVPSQGRTNISYLIQYLEFLVNFLFNITVMVKSSINY